MLFRHCHQRTPYRHRTHVAYGLVVILAIGTSCDRTSPPSAGNGNAPAPGPMVDGDDDGILPAEIDTDEISDTVDGVDDGILPAEIDTDEITDTVDGDDAGIVPAEIDTDETIDDGKAPTDVDVEEDTDGDGVPNDNDRCSDTAADAPVDANGCATGQLDSDSDGVTDDRDQCPDTPPESDVNGSGCAESQLDGDRDGVTDDRDVCPDTAPRTDVDETGCAISGAECGNGIVEFGEQCDPPDGSTCDTGCLMIVGQPPVCGNGTVEAGEECDDGNASAGDGCDASCRTEGLQNDSCASPLAVGDGPTSFDSTGASTDGAEEPEACDFFDSAQVESDVWFCYSATCGGQVVASLCGSNFDTKMAVYTGCDCPFAPPIGCSDDDCGVGMFDSRVTFQATEGQSYMIRIGGFEGAQGDGTLNIRCGIDSCGPDAGDCFTAHEGPGCDDEECCSTTCKLDAFCCDVVWDEFCADEASGLCTGSFAACAAGAGSCDTGNDSPGCETAECCNSVCMIDPFCCADKWDELCADEAANICGSSCGGATGSCFLPNDSPGCATESCCHTVCADDPFCCQTEWDQSCADTAAQTCR